MLCFEENRTLGRDWTVRYKNRFFQSLAERGRPSPGSRIAVRRRLDSSVLMLHGERRLKFVELPPEADLSCPQLDALYDSVTVRLFADQPERSVEVCGSPIVYGITIPTSAPRPELAREFIRLLISDEGREILRRSGQEPVVPVAYSSAGTADKPTS